MNGRIFLVHWNGSEADAYGRHLRAAGWEVSLEHEDGARACKDILAQPPDAVVIYLTRLPSHGRHTARYLRSRKATRLLPIVFVDGKLDAITKTKETVPDAIYTTAAELDGVLAQFSGSSARDHPSR